jgi:Tfp pilus assembly protein FimT
MLNRYAASLLGVAVVALLLAAPVQAHELTKKKAKNALKPVAAQLVATVGPAIAQKLPGATVAKSTVGGCEIKRSHRAECVISFSITGASTGETECGLDALVRFKSAKSKELKISTGPALICFFVAPLE